MTIGFEIEVNLDNSYVDQVSSTTSNLADFGQGDISLLVGGRRIFKQHMSLFVLYSQLLDAILEALLIEDYESVILGDFEPIAHLKVKDKTCLFLLFDGSSISVELMEVVQEMKRVSSVLVSLMSRDGSESWFTEKLSGDKPAAFAILNSALQKRQLR